MPKKNVGSPATSAFDKPINTSTQDSRNRKETPKLKNPSQQVIFTRQNLPNLKLNGKLSARAEAVKSRVPLN
jgi:hypothetical protein